MSHTTKSKLCVRDWDLFEAEVKKLGGNFNKEARQFTYYQGAKGTCNAGVISFPGAQWSAGVNFNEATGEADILMDNYGGGGGLNDKVGQNGCKLKESYTDSMINKIARQQGMIVKKIEPTREQKAQGVQAYWEAEEGALQANRI